MLIDPDGQGTRDHWDLTAHDLLVGVILHVLYAERDKTLHGCLTLLADPSRAIDATLTAMLTAAHDAERKFGWRNGTGQSTPTHPAVAGAARALLNKSDNERSSVVSSAVKFLNLYRDPIVVQNTETSDFAVRDLMHADVPVSLYLTILPADIHRTRPLLRLLLHQIVSRLTESMDVAEGRTVARYRHPLLLMLDEFPTLGRMDVLQTALAYLPGYGIRAYLIVQDLTQLAHAYGRYESIISNCHVRIAYAANKIETAKTPSSCATGSASVAIVPSFTSRVRPSVRCEPRCPDDATSFACKRPRSTPPSACCAEPAGASARGRACGAPAVGSV
jgi:type IV secretion system protein VirD4